MFVPIEKMWFHINFKYIFVNKDIHDNSDFVGFRIIEGQFGTTFGTKTGKT